MKRGQAALEFLMTYGWAILAAAVVIAALVAFGIFRPGAGVPPQCGTANTIMVGLGCNDYKITSGDITLVLTNGLGKALTVNSINVAKEGGTACTTPARGSIADGASATFVISGCNNGAAKSRFKGTITLNYTEEGSALSHIVTAILTREVE